MRYLVTAVAKLSSLVLGISLVISTVGCGDGKTESVTKKTESPPTPGQDGADAVGSKKVDRLHDGAKVPSVTLDEDH